MTERIYKSIRFASREVMAFPRPVLRAFRDMVPCARRREDRRHKSLRVRLARPSFSQEEPDAL